MPESNTTSSIQLSAISNLDSRNLDISHITSDASFVNVVNNLSIEVSYTDTSTNKIFSQKLALTDLFSAISSYVSHERSLTAETYLKVIDEERTWKPKPQYDSAAIIEPQIASNSDNSVHNCQLLKIMANGDKGQYINGLVIEITENGSIVFYSGIKKGQDELKKCNNMLVLWNKATSDSDDRTNINLRSKSDVAFITYKTLDNDILIDSTQNIANFFHLTSSNASLSSEGIVYITAGSKFNDNTIPILLKSCNSNTSSPSVNVLNNSTDMHEIRCIATRAKWA